MEIVITSWALDSYLALIGKGAFTRQEYLKVIRPDVLLLKKWPSHPKFQNNPKFWSSAPDSSGGPLHYGFKMKWHNMGNGKIQLRLPVGVFTEAILCESYVKKNEKQEKRQLARFKTHLRLIHRGLYTERGRLS